MISSSHSMHRVGRQLSPRLYLAILIVLPLLAIPAMVALGSSDFFLHHGASVWVQTNDSIFAMRDRDCDVLLFGDSTVMTGLDPQQIAAITGLRTCNIAVTNAVLAVTDNLPLDYFLAHNTRPKVLLLQFSPDDLERESHIWTRSIYAEGMLELLRHGTRAEINRTLFLHPRETLAFAGYVAGYTAYYGLRRVWSTITGQPLEEQRVTIRNGFFTPPMAALTACEPAAHTMHSSDRTFPTSFINDLREKYKDQAGVVLVNVAAIPACDDNLAAYQKQLTGLTSNSLLGLPVHLFNDERHYTAEGAHLTSRAAAQEILAAEARRSP